MANTTAWAASSGHQLVSSTTARTTVVIQAASLGPRGSTEGSADMVSSWPWTRKGRAGGGGGRGDRVSRMRQDAAHRPVRKRADTGCCRRGRSPPRGAWSARGTRARAYSRLPRTESEVQSVGRPGLTGADGVLPAACDAAERRRRAAVPSRPRLKRDGGRRAQHGELAARPPAGRSRPARRGAGRRSTRPGRSAGRPSACTACRTWWRAGRGSPRPPDRAARGSRGAGHRFSPRGSARSRRRSTRPTTIAAAIAPTRISAPVTHHRRSAGRSGPCR